VTRKYNHCRPIMRVLSGYCNFQFPFLIRPHKIGATAIGWGRGWPLWR
jgi:hypothetical protein